VLHGCFTGGAAHLRFFDRLTGAVWPRDRQAAHELPADESGGYAIPCLAGASVCYGAAQTDGRVVWGAGLDGKRPCADCCVSCGQSASFTLRCP
jgi:hypothetical protein